jgi:hypothetical protein
LFDDKLPGEYARHADTRSYVNIDQISEHQQRRFNLLYIILRFICYIAMTVDK